MPTKQRRKLIIYLITLLFILLFAWLIFQISARVILCRAVSDVTNELKESVRQSPVHILFETLSDEQGNTAEANITLIDTPVGDIHLETMFSSRKQQLLTAGSIFASELESDFSLYLDQNTLAVSSDLLSEGYYGITFDTFEQDIRRIPMLSWIIDDDTIKAWDDSIQNIKRKIGNTRSIPDLSKLDIFQKTDFSGMLMVMPVQIDRIKLIQNGKTVPVMRMVYKFHGDQIPRVIKETFSLDALTNMEVTASFYLQKQKFVMGEILIREENNATSILLEKNIISSTENTSFHFSTKGKGDREEIFFAFERSGLQNEHWHFSTGEDIRSVSILWDPASGEMTLSDKEEKLALIFQKKENGFSLETEDLFGLVKLIGSENAENSSWKASGKVIVAKGGNPQKPEYKNLDQWSFEDFLTLLDGIGSLIGWKLS